MEPLEPLEPPTRGQAVCLCTLMSTGSSVRPAYPGFIVMAHQALHFSCIVVPSNTKLVCRAAMARWMSRTWAQVQAKEGDLSSAGCKNTASKAKGAQSA
eukprot:1160450-Pelagomonas_calceolata.AAC.1